MRASHRLAAFQKCLHSDPLETTQRECAEDTGGDRSQEGQKQHPKESTAETDPESSCGLLLWEGNYVTTGQGAGHCESLPTSIRRAALGPAFTG